MNATFKFTLLLVIFVQFLVPAPHTSAQEEAGFDYFQYLPASFYEYRSPPPIFPPVNKVVYISGYNAGNPRYGVYVMNPDGSGRTNLLSNSTISYSRPVWSPDGTQIAFTAIWPDGSGGYNNRIHIMNANGTGEYNLVNIPGHHFHSTWSPYGNEIAFSSDMHLPGATTPNDIYLINADGSGQPTNLTNTPAIHEYAPSWSPDGLKIAYVAASGSDFSVVEIYVMKYDGSDPVNLTNSAAADYAPGWSPDSQKIVFYRNLGSTNTPNRQIFVMNANGSGQTQLTFNSGQNWFPDWSPDGSKIIFQTYYNAYADIYVMNANGSGVTNITNTQSQYASGYPDWE
jgi:Tol biopolymer transport system component